MIDHQLRGRGIENEAVISAMLNVSREEFIKKDLVEFAYRDAPLPIEEKQSISQPYMVALMIELMDLESDDRVLDIGTGSGYAAAVMSRIASDVYSIERHKVLADTARERLMKLGYGNVHVLHGNGAEGWPEHAPFDAVNVAAAGEDIPQPLQEQLGEGGRMIIPVGPGSRSQRLIRLKKKHGAIERENLGRVRFVPLVGRKADGEGEGEGELTKKPAVQEKYIPSLIQAAAEPVSEIASVNLDSLMDRIGDARVVLLGESTHGTAEFYDMRARITMELVRKKGFNIVSAEADWPDASHIDRFIRNTDTGTPEEQPFTRFPRWMWRNKQFLEFVNRLKSVNGSRKDAGDKVRFYGLDFYSIYSSINAIVNYLESRDAKLADIAKYRYGCLTLYENDPATYAAAAMSDRYKECEKDVVAMLRKLIDSRNKLQNKDGTQYYDAIQNARLVANAEKYYRSMYYSSRSSWNVRDSHMFETLESLLEHHGSKSKAVVWAHNSHIGNASATEMGARGEHNLGQLVREKMGEKVYSIGFGTDHGTVAAASNWGERMEIKDINPSVSDSTEQLMHLADVDSFMLPLHDKNHRLLSEEMQKSRLQRAIGVIYRPATELESHYFQASLANQYDEFIWFDETRAVIALEEVVESTGLPETFPFGL
ncbi:MAG: protein-L-isoaspartate(D-aspartate) O-methyltransferase [Balneolaceae bacterium]